MFYDFQCPVDNEIVEVGMSMNGISPVFCGKHDQKMIRLYSAPQINIPEQSAVDVLNRHARGEGDPLPGYTQAQTMWMANEKARIQKREKGQKSASGPSQSFPGGGAVSRTYGD